MDSPKSSYKIPVVDFGKLTDPGRKEVATEEDWQRIAKELHDAMAHVGFAYLSNHGISEEQINTLFKASSDFFSLSDETKALYDADMMKKAHGYNSIDRERLEKAGNLKELRESFYIHDMNGAFPDVEVPLFRSSGAAFLSSCTTLAHSVLAALALGLGLEKDFFVMSHQHICDGTNGSSSVLRINHYPPIPDSVPENAIRCGAHTDYGSITLLFQDSMGGLQVRSTDGEWVDAKPIPGTVLINAGDLLQIWTANRVVATEHRVVIPKEETLMKASRLSAAFFMHPDHEVLVQPIDGSSSPPPIKARQHLLNMYAKTYKY